MSVIRPAVRDDISEMHRVRLSVRENKLTTSVIVEADYVPAIEKTGRGWVAECDGEIVGFAVANRENGSLWALFVEPDHEGCGHGRRLHETAVSWLRTQGLDRLWLNTEPGTRAQGFYESLGWIRTGLSEHGEIRFELAQPVKQSQNAKLGTVY